MIINHTKDVIISQKELICKSIFSQIRGLMFRKKQNVVMIFKKEREIQLHNVFVFFPLEIIVLNKDKVVTDMNRQFLPFCLGWSSYGQYVLELGEEEAKGKIEIGDRLEF